MVLKDNSAVDFYKKIGGILVEGKEIKIGEQILLEQCYAWSNLLIKNKF
jgi:hypothetical protein